MTEQYQVTIQGQLGPREGVLTLSYQESYITGSLDLVGYVNKVPIQTVVSTSPCETVLKLQAGSLCGTSTSKSAQMRWEGALLHQGPREASEL